MNFVITKDFKSPYAVATGMPHKPTALKTAKFNKGQIIKGELKKDAVGKSAFVMFKNTIVVPLDCVKQVVTKEVNMSNVTGGNTKANTSNNLSIMPFDKTPTKDEQKKRYADAIIIGAILGFIGVYYAEKQGYIQAVEQKNRVIGAVAGGLAGAYLVYRFKK
jgi:hypothetical protein